MAITRLSIDGYGARRAGSFAGRVEVVPPAVAEEPNNLSGGKPEKKKKRRKSLYDDVENNARFVVPTSFETAESVPLEAIPESADTSKPVSVDGLSAMSEAFQKAGIRTSEQFIQKQESIDRRRKLNLAAIILLLD